MYLLLNLGARFLVAQMFIMAGVSKLGRFAATQAYMEHMGVPGVLLPLVMLTEIGGGLALLFGFQTRWVAFLLAGFTLISAVIFHRNFADQLQLISFMKNLAICGGLLMFVVYGAGHCQLPGPNKSRPEA